MMTKISTTSSELGYQLQQQQQQQQQNEHLYSNQLMLSSTPPSINCYRKIRSTEDLTTMLSNETSMTTLQQQQSHLQEHNNLKFSTLNASATMVDENNHNARALQLALELSIVSLNAEQQNHSMNSSQRLLLNSSIDHQPISKSTNSIMTSNILPQPLQNEHQFQKSFLENSSLALGMIEERTKKSQNMTECVPVPSSEHVAEIVGRQGCKIKALRAKTNTYIKTPVRGEEPVFVVTGRKEDVAKAKREILSAAEHFSLIRAARNPSRQTFTTNATTILPPINDIDCTSQNLLDENKITTNIDASIFKLNDANDKQQQQSQQQSQQQQQQITIQVRVPYRVVGLVVGPKGSTIKHIQQETQTYIVTPSREKQPIFEVTGSHENVQLARKQIEAHIAIRTGNLTNSLPTTTAPTTIYGGTGSGTRIQKQKLCKTIEDDIEYEKNVCLYRSNHNHDDMALNEFLNDMTTLSSTTSTSTISAASTETTICTINSLSQMLNEGENLQPEFLETFYRTFDYKDNNIQQLRQQHQQHQPPRPQQIFKLEKSDNNDVFYNEQEQQLSQFLKTQQKQLTSTQTVATTSTTAMTALLNFNARSSSSASSSTSSKSAQNCYIAVGDHSGIENGVGGGFATNWKHNLGDSLDTDEGISESSLIWVLPTTASGIATTTLTQSIISTTTTTTATNTTSTAISPTDSLLCHSSSSSNEIQHQHQHHSQNIFYTKSHQQQQQQPQQPQFKRDSCLICGYQEVSAALIPCGHDLFCLDCAQHICSSLEPNCPICNNNVYQAVRLTS